MDIFDIFSVDGKYDTPIEYASFQEIGWMPNDYLIYIALCEDIRAATILSDKFNNLLCTRRDVDYAGKDIVLQSFNDLLHFLQKYTTKTIADVTNKSYLSHLLCGWIRYGSSRHQRKYSGGNNPNPYLVYKSYFHFRADVEYLVGIVLHNPDGLNSLLLEEFSIEIKGISEMTLEEVQERIVKIKAALNRIQEPWFNEIIDSYYRLVVWARAQNEYDDTCDLEDELEELEIRKRELQPPGFVQKKDVLYVYQGGNIVCKKWNHRIVNVNCHIQILDEIATINAQFCCECEKFIISKTGYDDYRKAYRFLPVLFDSVDKNGDFPRRPYWSRDRYDEMADCSPLMMAGYSVSKNKGYTDEERHNLLAFLMDKEIVPKDKIIGYLEWFKTMHGANAKNAQALKKWDNDLQFVRGYNMGRQRNYQISRISRY